MSIQIHRGWIIYEKITLLTTSAATTSGSQTTTFVAISQEESELDQ